MFTPRGSYRRLNVEPTLSYSGISGQELENATVRWFFITSAPSHCFKQNVVQKLKILKFGTNIVLTGYFGLEFEKANAEFKINLLEFVNMQGFI